MSALIGLLIIVAVLILAEGLRRLTEPGLGAQLPQIILGLDNTSPAQSFMHRHILPSSDALTRRFDFLRPLSEPEKTAKKLEYAGQPYGMDADQFFGFQLFMMLAGFALGGIYATFGILFDGCGWPFALLGGPIAGFLYPRLWLNWRVNERQENITLSMPDFLDMMAISVQAGMGFENALRLVTVHLSGPLSSELRRLIRELDMGEPRTLAFHRLVNRNTSEDLRAYVDALLQAEELGTPIAKMLETQASELRLRRVHRAKEKAGKASPKISLVIVLLLSPSVICLFITLLVLGVVIGGDLGSLTPP